MSWAFGSTWTCFPSTARARRHRRGATTFGELVAVTLSVDQRPGHLATLDGGTTETVLVLARVYRRGDRWRVRATCHGYDDGLDALAQRYGVAVERD